MPRKKFEETPYDPIAADLMREVVAGGRGETPVLTMTPAPHPVVESDASSRCRAAPVVVVATPERSPEPTITKRFLLTRSENEELEAFLLRVQRRAGTKVTLSMFTRASLNVAMQAEEYLLAEVGEGTPRRFPSTHDNIAQGAFEEWWMRCLTNALRRLPRGVATLRTV